MKIGDIAGGDYTEITGNNAVQMYGDSAGWDDLLGDIFSKKIYSNTGKIDYDWDNNMMKFQHSGDITNKNDRVQLNVQQTHKFKIGTDTKYHWHMHYIQEIVSGSASVNAVFTFKYRFLRNGYALPTTWTTVTATTGTDDVFDLSSEPDGFYNQIMHFPEILVNSDVSDVMQIMIARTDKSGDDVLVSFFDAHLEVSSIASSTEYQKTV